MASLLDNIKYNIRKMAQQFYDDGVSLYSSINKYLNRKPKQYKKYKVENPSLKIFDDAEYTSDSIDSIDEMRTIEFKPNYAPPLTNHGLGNSNNVFADFSSDISHPFDAISVSAQSNKEPVKKRVQWRDSVPYTKQFSTNGSDSLIVHSYKKGILKKSKKQPYICNTNNYDKALSILFKKLAKSKFATRSVKHVDAHLDDRLRELSDGIYRSDIHIVARRAFNASLINSKKRMPIKVLRDIFRSPETIALEQALVNNDSSETIINSLKNSCLKSYNDSLHNLELRGKYILKELEQCITESLHEANLSNNVQQRHMYNDKPIKRISAARFN